MNWAPTDPRTLLAGGALLVLAVLGGVAIGMASEGGNDDAAPVAGADAEGTPGSGSSSPPAAPQTGTLVPVFLPVAEGAAPPATTATDDAAPPDPDDAPSATPSATPDAEPPPDGTAAVLRPVDFAGGYEARGNDMPSLEPTAPTSTTGDTPTEGDAPPESPTEAPSEAADGEEPDAADAADGDGDDGAGDDEPMLVDLCAGDDPPDGCDEGVLGTIWLATHIPVTIDDVAAHRTLPASCAASTATLSDGDVALVVTTNQPVSLAVSWDYADGGTSGSATGATDADQAAAFDRGERDSVVTCAAVTGPSDQPTTRPTIRVEATPPDGGDTAVWEQPLELGDTVLPSDVSRPERPPLQVRWLDDRRIDVWVPVGPDETAQAWLVRRNPDHPSVRRCRAAEDGSLGSLEAIVSPPIGRRALARVPGADHGFTSTLQFGLVAFGAGQHDVCVRWQDGPDPAPVTERTAVQVRFDELPRVEVLLAGASTSAPHPTSVTVGVGCGTQTWPLTDLNSADEVAPHVLCEQTLGGVTSGTVPIAHRVDWGADPGATADGVLRMLVGACDPGDMPACTRWYRLPLLGTEGEVSGELTVGLRPVSVPEVEWRPRTGPEQAYGEAEPEPEHPRMDPGSVVLEPDPASPTDTLRLRLRTVDPADVAVQLVVADRRATGAACATRWPRATADGAQAGATLVFGELCPGTRYRAVVTVRAPGDPAPAAVYGGDPATHDVPVLPLDAAASTDPLRLEVSATMQIVHRGDFVTNGNKRVIPSIVSLRAGPAISSFSQSYLARARMELWCGPVGDLGQQIEPTVVDVGAVLPVVAHARVHYWDERGSLCPGIKAQFNRWPAPPDDPDRIAPSRRTHTRSLSLRLDAATTLRAGTRTFVTPLTSERIEFEVTVTVREIPAD